MLPFRYYIGQKVPGQHVSKIIRIGHKINNHALIMINKVDKSFTNTLAHHFHQFQYIYLLKNNISDLDVNGLYVFSYFFYGEFSNVVWNVKTHVYFLMERNGSNGSFSDQYKSLRSCKTLEFYQSLHFAAIISNLTQDYLFIYFSFDKC